MKKVNVYLGEGFEEIEAITVEDLLRRGGVHVNTVAIGTSLTVTGAHGIPVVADSLLDDGVKEADGHVLPGGMPGTENLLLSAELKELMKREARRGALIAAICAAPSVLGRWGLLEGKKATCYPGFEKFLDKASIQNTEVVVDGRTVTSRGAGTAMEFGLALVEQLSGRAKMEDVRGGLLYKA